MPRLQRDGSRSYPDGGRTARKVGGIACDLVDAREVILARRIGGTAARRRILADGRRLSQDRESAAGCRRAELARGKGTRVTLSPANTLTPAGCHFPILSFSACLAENPGCRRPRTQHSPRECTRPTGAPFFTRSALIAKRSNLRAGQLSRSTSDGEGALWSQQLLL